METDAQTASTVYLSVEGRCITTNPLLIFVFITRSMCVFNN